MGRLPARIAVRTGRFRRLYAPDQPCTWNILGETYSGNRHDRTAPQPAFSCRSTRMRATTQSANSVMSRWCLHVRGGQGGIQDCTRLSARARRRMHAHTHIVRQILMRRSQLQPVIIAAAAGGKRMAIYRAKSVVSPPLARLHPSCTHKDQADVRTTNSHGEMDM